MNLTEIKLLFEYGVEKQILKSDTTSCNINKAVERVRAWKREGYVVVFTAGVFDIFTLNHLLGLYHYKMLGGKKSKLVITIDTDKRVESSKAYKLAKGGSIKPILSWDSRALMVAKQHMSNGKKLVDLILQHGSDTCGGACPHDDNVSIAEMVLPDIVVVTSESTYTIEALRQSSLIPDKSIFVINEEDLSYNDTLLGEKISNTAIARRIKYGDKC